MQSPTRRARGAPLAEIFCGSPSADDAYDPTDPKACPKS